MSDQTVFLVPVLATPTNFALADVSGAFDIFGFGRDPAATLSDGTVDVFVSTEDAIADGQATAEATEGENSFLFGSVVTTAFQNHGRGFSTAEGRALAANRFEFAADDTLSFSLAGAVSGFKTPEASIGALFVLAIDYLPAGSNHLQSYEIAIDLSADPSSGGPLIGVTAPDGNGPGVPQGELLVDVFDGVSGEGDLSASLFFSGDFSLEVEAGSAVNVTSALVTSLRIDSDPLIGRLGNDVTYGTVGNDHLHGEKLYGSFGNDFLRGTNGDDILEGGGDDDKLMGRRGDDLISGGDGNDRLRGDRGDDHLVGGCGDDRLSGGFGSDIFEGGEGADVFDLRLKQVNGRDSDLLVDVSFDEGDQVVLRGRIFGQRLPFRSLDSEEDLEEAILLVNNDNRPNTEAFARDGEGGAGSDLVFKFQNYELVFAGYGELAEEDDPDGSGTTFELRDAWNEFSGLALTDADAVLQASYERADEIDGMGRIGDFDQRVLVIEDFDLSEGDRLVFRDVDTIDGGGTVASASELLALARSFVGLVDADGDGVMNDIHLSVDQSGFNWLDGSYDIVLRDIGGVRADLFNGVDMAAAAADYGIA